MKRNSIGTGRPLITARSSFGAEALDKPGHCSGCGAKHPIGAQVFVKRYKDARVNRKQICRVILCNLDECWQDYDLKMFPGVKT